MTAVLSTARTASFFGARAMRSLGLYVAGSLGGLQFMDVLSDRLGIPDRVFLGAMILLILGAPLVVAAAMLVETAKRERALPRIMNRMGSEPAGGEASAASPLRTAQAPTVSGPAVVTNRPAAPAEEAIPDDVGNGYSLALVHHRLARMYDGTGDPTEAAAQYRRFLELWDRADAEHRPLVADAQQRLSAMEDLEAGST